MLLLVGDFGTSGRRSQLMATLLAIGYVSIVVWSCGSQYGCSSVKARTGILPIPSPSCRNLPKKFFVEVGGIEPPCLDLGSEASPGAAGDLSLGSAARTGALGTSQPGWCSPRYPVASGE